MAINFNNDDMLIEGLSGPQTINEPIDSLSGLTGPVGTTGPSGLTGPSGDPTNPEFIYDFVTKNPPIKYITSQGFDTYEMIIAQPGDYQYWVHNWGYAGLHIRITLHFTSTGSFHIGVYATNGYRPYYFITGNGTITEIKYFAAHKQAVQFYNDADSITPTNTKNFNISVTDIFWGLDHAVTMYCCDSSVSTTWLPINKILFIRSDLFVFKDISTEIGLTNNGQYIAYKHNNIYYEWPKNTQAYFQNGDALLQPINVLYTIKKDGNTWRAFLPGDSFRTNILGRDDAHVQVWNPPISYSDQVGYYFNKWHRYSADQYAIETPLLKQNTFSERNNDFYDNSSNYQHLETDNTTGQDAIVLWDNFWDNSGNAIDFDTVFSRDVFSFDSYYVCANGNIYYVPDNYQVLLFKRTAKCLPLLLEDLHSYGTIMERYVFEEIVPDSSDSGIWLPRTPYNNFIACTETGKIKTPNNSDMTMTTLDNSMLFPECTMLNLDLYKGGSNQNRLASNWHSGANADWSMWNNPSTLWRWTFHIHDCKMYYQNCSLNGVTNNWTLAPDSLLYPFTLYYNVDKQPADNEDEWIVEEYKSDPDYKTYKLSADIGYFNVLLSDDTGGTWNYVNFEYLYRDQGQNKWKSTGSYKWNIYWTGYFWGLGSYKPFTTSNWTSSLSFYSSDGVEQKQYSLQNSNDWQWRMYGGARYGYRAELKKALRFYPGLSSNIPTNGFIPMMIVGTRVNNPINNNPDVPVGAKWYWPGVTFPNTTYFDTYTDTGIYLTGSIATDQLAMTLLTVDSSRDEITFYNKDPIFHSWDWVKQYCCYPYRIHRTYSSYTPIDTQALFFISTDSQASTPTGMGVTWGAIKDQDQIDGYALILMKV